MNCRVIYDLNDGFWTDMHVGGWITLGLVGTIIPIALIIAAQFPALRPFGRLPGRFGQVVLAIAAVAAAIASLKGISDSQRVFAALRDSYLLGHYATLTGTIDAFRDETFHPVVPGELSIGGHAFVWDPYGQVQRFSAAIRANRPGSYSYPPPFISALHDGMRIRLRFMNDRVIRLEALASELPSDLATGAPTCGSAL